MAQTPAVRLAGAALLAFFVSAPDLVAQGVGTNARFLSNVNRFPGATTPRNNYAGIWGLVVNGREMAVVPTRTGTLIYDCSDPRNPVEKAFISGPTTSGTNFWREAQSWGTWVYISSEHGALQVVDLSDPDLPVLAGTFGGAAHTVTIDQGTGYLWANGGAGNGCRIYNLNTNPVSPTLIRTYNPAYVHDSYVAKGFGYFGHIFGGTMRIANVTDPRNIVTLSNTQTPGAFTHNVWPNDAHTIVVTADENRGGCLTIYDISNKSSPQQLATWCSPNGATVHNVMLKGQIAHFSSYSDGYWAIDLSTPSAPVPICQFDTSTLTGSNYHGCWGCYPYQPSGVVYLTDMQSGFWIVEPIAGVPNLYGNGTPGTGGVIPSIDFDGGHAQVGNITFALMAENVLANTPTALLVGGLRAQIPFLGIQFLVDPLSAILLPGAANGSGISFFPVPIPNVPSLSLGTIHAQIVALDAGGPGGLSASRGFTVTVK